MPGNPHTVDHEIRQAADSRGDRRFLEFVPGKGDADGRGGIHEWTATYGELEERTGWVGAALRRIGISRGEHVALLMRNRPEFVLSWLGASRVGNPVIPVNAGLKGDGLAYVLNHSDAVAVIVEDEQASAIAAIRDDLPNIRHFIGVGESYVDALPDARPWSDLMEVRPLPDVDVAPTDPMAVMYTSGTTGLPKGVLLPHSRIMTGRMILRWAGVVSEDKLYTCLPLFHANAALISFWGTFGLGGQLVVSRRFSASRMWGEISRTESTVLTALGAMIPILAKQSPRAGDANNTARLVISAACPKDIWRDFEQRFGVSIVELYGTVEGGLTIAGPEAPIGSIGKPPPGVEVRIARSDGSVCGPGEVGELVARPSEGAAEVKYYKDPRSSAKKTSGGWLHTGDRAYRDADGYFWYVDRDEHFMRRRGENISSSEIEQVVAMHPSVLECAAYGIPSELGEDEVAIAVVLRPEVEIPPHELVDFCRPRMADFQLPRFIRIVTELPKTETHRAKKVSLRNEGITPDMWDREQPTTLPLS
ncbi:AMP-binding protein [Nocardia sp. SC052]|uniref:AMP-binding protein n=1 Tax=Nocardia sichangensis TaxID=3385975 RepID=UPI0039A2910A